MAINTIGNTSHFPLSAERRVQMGYQLMTEQTEVYPIWRTAPLWQA
jgi:hypothetical protein